MNRWRDYEDMATDWVTVMWVLFMVWLVANPIGLAYLVFGGEESPHFFDQCSYIMEDALEDLLLIAFPIEDEPIVYSTKIS